MNLLRDDLLTFFSDDSRDELHFFPFDNCVNRFFGVI